MSIIPIKSKCRIFVKPLKLKKVSTLIPPWLFYFKLIVDLHRGKIHLDRYIYICKTFSKPESRLFYDNQCLLMDSRIRFAEKMFVLSTEAIWHQKSTGGPQNYTVSQVLPCQDHDLVGEPSPACEQRTYISPPDCKWSVFRGHPAHCHVCLPTLLQSQFQKGKHTETKVKMFERIPTFSQRKFYLLQSVLYFSTQAKEGTEAIGLIWPSSHKIHTEMCRRQIKCWLDSTVVDSSIKLTDFDLKRVKPNLSLAAENQVKALFQSSFQFIQHVTRDHKKYWKFQRGKRKRATQGSAAWGQQCGGLCLCVLGRWKIWHKEMMPSSTSLSSFSEVVLLGPGKFKNRAFLMEKRADGKTENSQSLES